MQVIRSLTMRFRKPGNPSPAVRSSAARRDRSFKTRCPKFVRDAAEILEEM
jgi:hypothetical protein